MYINRFIKCAFTNIWILRRLVEIGLTRKHLILTYISRIQVYIEQNIPLWAFSISQEFSRNIENVQFTSAFIILGKYAQINYTANISTLNLDSLQNKVNKFAKSLLWTFLNTLCIVTYYNWRVPQKPEVVYL